MGITTTDNATGAPAAKPPRILIVDDYPSVARILGRILSGEGYTVSTVTSAAAALECAATEHFDLLVSDIAMPEMDGWDLMRTLLSRGPILGIAVSAHDSAEHRRRSLEAGFALHLSKPTDADTLIEAVAGVLGQKAR